MARDLAQDLDSEQEPREEEHGGDHAAEHEAAQLAEQQAAGPQPVPPTAAPAEATSATHGPTASEQAMGEAPAAHPLFGWLTGGRSRGGDDEAKKKKDKDKGENDASRPWTAQSIANLVRFNNASTVIRRISRHDSTNAVTLLQASGAWERLLGALPTGGDLNAGTRRGLFRLVRKGAVDLDTAKRLFQIRFEHELTDDTGSWTMATVKVVWRQLDALPESDVSENQLWSVIAATTGGGGMYIDSDRIEIGEDGDPAEMGHTVRHEIGHGVHEELAGVVNAWLQGSIDFWYTTWEGWIDELGGFPAKYTDPTDGTEKDFDDTAKEAVKDMIETFTGDQQWDPTRGSPEEGRTDLEQAYWAAMPAKVKNACAQSVSQWYDNWTSFQKNGGKRYFLNHWYHKPYRFGATAATSITATGDTYTAMSEFEFFANCYAEYFADPKGYNDHSKWGGNLPSPVKQFFRTCIVRRQPYEKFEKKMQRRQKGRH